MLLELGADVGAKEGVYSALGVASATKLELELPDEKDRLDGPAAASVSMTFFVLRVAVPQPVLA